MTRYRVLFRFRAAGRMPVPAYDAWEALCSCWLDGFGGCNPDPNCAMHSEAERPQGRDTHAAGVPERDHESGGHA